MLGAGVYKKTVTGNPAIAQGSLARRYPGITMRGWTEQNSYEGKNLLPVDVGQEFTGTVVTDNVTFEEDGVHAIYESIVSGEARDIYMYGSSNRLVESGYVEVPSLTPGDYRLVNDNVGISLYVVAWRNGASVVLGYANNVSTKITIQDGDKFRIFLRCNIIGDTDVKIHPMIMKEGEDTTTYEPYTGGAPSPSPDYPQEIVSAGNWNEETQKWEYEIEVGGNVGSYQTVLLTSDRPLTKWDRLEKRNGQWGWVYKSDEVVLDGSEQWKTTGNGFYIAGGIKNTVAYDKNMLIDKLIYASSGEYPRFIVVSGGGAYTPSIFNVADSVNGMKEWLASNPLTLRYETAEETFVPLSEAEQEQMNELYTFRPTTVLSNDCECSMSLTYKTKKSLQSVPGGVRKPKGVSSYFNFGVKWNQINKIVIKISGVTERNCMFLCGVDKSKIFIAIGTDNSWYIASLNNFAANISYDEVLDGLYHEIIFTFDNPSMNASIGNVWDTQWSKNIVYHEIIFYNGDNLIADYVPYYKGAGYMLDKKNNVVIRATNPEDYQFA